MTLLLSESDVDRCLELAEAIEVLREAFAAHGRGRIRSLPRWRPDERFHLLAAALPDQGVYGLKSIAPAARHVHLYSWTDGRLQAVLASDRLSRLRTAATTALATDLLARPDARVHALLGAGSQAAMQAHAVAAVRPIRDLRIWSRSAQRRERLAAELGGRAVETAARAVAGAGVVTTVTRAADPLFPGEALAAGCHVTAVGSTWPERAEVDATTVSRAARIVVELRDEATTAAGDLIRGGADWARVIELGALAAGLVPGRGGPEEITLCKTLGVAFGDVALARHVLSTAHRLGLGREVDLG